MYFNTSYVTVQPIPRTRLRARNAYFNTSYVTVQRRYEFAFGTRKKISIHLMLRFNQSSSHSQPSSSIFQYILCYGSTTYGGKDRPLISSFQYILCYGSTFIKTIVRITIYDFNTSYVTVQQLKALEKFGIFPEFQYILCYGSTTFIFHKKIPPKISIHLMLRFNSCTYAFYISHHIK